MTRSLNLDPNFTPTIYDGLEMLASKKFSGGEQHIVLNTSADFSRLKRVIITHRITNGDDLMKIMMAHDALLQEGVKKNRIELIIPYMPYARQDRLCNKGEAFSLKVFAKLINSMKLKRVTILDSHSDVAPALLDNCVNIDNIKYVQFSLIDIHTKHKDLDTYPILVSPDSGANKKINKVYEALHENLSIVVKCVKHRNLSDGAITGFEVFADDLRGAPCIIVDDICDGGRTFIGIAEALKKKGAGPIYLFVTHGIFSYGLEPLKELIEGVYTTNSFNDGSVVKDSFVTRWQVEL